MNKKVYCKECNLIYDEKEVEKLHKLSNFEKHTYIKDNLPFEAVVHLCNRVKELEKKPITIDILNTRVDTARDLALKLNGKTKEMMRTAMFSEMAIVYGNRYRSSEKELDRNLKYAESLFLKGEYKKSLELTINSLNRIEPGIYEKLLEISEKRTN